MNELKLNVNGKEITIQVTGGIVFIDIPKSLCGRMVVNVANGGLPGINGPDVPIDIGTALAAINIQAEIRARQGW